MDLTIQTQDGQAAIHQGAGDRRQLLHQLADGTLAEALWAKGFHSSGLLPPAVRWVSASGRQAIFERPPQHQTINFADVKKSGVTRSPNALHQFTLPLPWTIYAVTLNWQYHLSSLKVYAANHSLRALNDSLWTLPLPNVWEDSRYCLPNISACRDANLATGLQMAYEAVWASGFNRDITFMPHLCAVTAQPEVIFRQPAPEGRLTPEAAFFTRWEQTQLRDIVAVQDWATPRTTAGEVIAELAQYEEQLLSAHTLTSSIVAAATPNRARNGIAPAV